MFSTIAKFPSPGASPLWTVAWNRKSNKVVAGSIDGLIATWNGETMEKTGEVQGHSLAITSIDSASSSAVVVTSSLDHQVKIWDLQQLSMMRSLEVGPVEAMNVSISPNGQNIAAGNYAGQITIIPCSVSALEHENSAENTLDTVKGKFITAVDYSGSGSFLAAGSETGHVYVFDLAVSKLLHSFSGHTGHVRSVKFNADSSLLVTSGDDKKVLVYDVVHGNLIHTFSGHSSTVFSVSPSSHNNYIASCSADQKVKIWDMTSKQCIHTFHDHTDQVWGVSFNDIGTKLVSVGNDIVFHTVQ